MIPITPDELTREHILKLSQYNSIVYRMVSYWQAGHLTFEQALIGMVHYLVQTNDELIRMKTEKLYTIITGEMND